MEIIILVILIILSEDFMTITRERSKLSKKGFEKLFGKRIVSSEVEHFVDIEGVVGSIPTRSTNTAHTRLLLR